MAPAAVALPKNYGQKGYVKVYRGDELLVTELVMVSITLIIVALRLFTRVYILGAMHSDDWWIILATSVLVALTAVHGVGLLPIPSKKLVLCPLIRGGSKTDGDE